MMDVLMNWSQVIALGGLIVGMCSFFFWQLNALRADMRAFTAEIRNDMRAFTAEIRADMKAFHKEMSKFNGRLCTLEEKYQQIDRR